MAKRGGWHQSKIRDPAPALSADEQMAAGIDELVKAGADASKDRGRACGADEQCFRHFLLLAQSEVAKCRKLPKAAPAREWLEEAKALAGRDSRYLASLALGRPHEPEVVWLELVMHEVERVTGNPMCAAVGRAMGVWPDANGKPQRMMDIWRKRVLAGELVEASTGLRTRRWSKKS